MGSVVLGEWHGSTSVDPFGEADPVEAARVVRRALAAADRKAFDVRRLVVVRDARPDADAMARFARRALGPHGSTVPTAWVATSTEAVARDDVPAEGVWVELLVGPGSQVSARCRG
jgi:hypothetical protein